MPITSATTSSDTLVLIENLKETLNPVSALTQTLRIRQLSDLLDPQVLWLVFLRITPGLMVGSITFLILYYGRQWLNRYLSEASDNGIKTDWQSWALRVVRSTRTWFISLQSLLAAIAVMPLFPAAMVVIGHAAAILTIIQAGIWLNQLVHEGARRHLASHPGDGARATTVATLLTVAGVVVWAVVVLMVLANVGVNVSALVAGLGIGGVAIAFASQNILQSIFASLATVFDSPFALGDYITTKEHGGSVEKIGLKTTTLRAPGGEQILVANNDLFQNRIINFGRMKERRVFFTIQLAYGTPADRLAQVPGLIRSAIESHEKVRFDRSHLQGFLPDGLNVETIYYMTVADYALMMDTQQAVILSIYRALEEQGISFAVPVQKQVASSWTSPDDHLPDAAPMPAIRKAKA